MSILIKGMDMPKDCAECDIHNPLADTPYCRRLLQRIPREGRLENCPLIEVPTPHGRLKDESALKTDTEYDLYLDDFTSYTKRQIDLAPTVIEAEE